MRFVRGARAGFLLACLPILNMGCASLSPKLSALPSIARNRADVQYVAAQNAEQRGQWQKARELYMTLQRNSPNVPEYAHRMGVVCTQLGDFETATQYFEHARSLDPQKPELLSDMGYASYLQKDYGRAETLLTESVHLRSDDARAVNNLAMAIGFQGRYEESLITFLRVNTETQSLLNVAYIHSQRNEPEQAIVLYQRVLASDPVNRVATNALHQLRSTRPTALPVTDRQTSVVAAGAQRSAAPVHQTSGMESQATQLRQDLPALLSRGADGSPAISITPAGTAVTRPVITSAAELQPQRDFQAPVITPFSSFTEPAAEPAQNPPREIKVALTDEDIETPQRQLPSEQVPADSREAALHECEEAVASAPSNSTRDELAKAVDGAENCPEPAGRESEELMGLEWANTERSQQSAAAAAADKPAGVYKHDCFKGFCPVAIRDERCLRSTSDEFSWEFQDQTYRFSSAEALLRFQEHPDWYAPVAGGLDATEVDRGQAVAQGSLDYAVWFRHRLYMFSSAENLATFRAAPRQFAANP